MMGFVKFKYSIEVDKPVHQALHMQASTKAFKMFTSAELLATFCDNLLKKGNSEKLCDEIIENTLEKVK